MTNFKDIEEVLRIGAKDNFVLFCYYVDYDFFKARTFLKPIAQAFQDIADSNIKTLAVSLPPRAGKSYVTTLFCAWLLGKYPAESVMRNTCTATLARKLSRQTRDIVISEKFKAVFPDVQLSSDNSAVDAWALESSKNGGYFGQGVGGTIIGFGASKVAITDDLFKSIDDAMSDTIKDKTLSWLHGTHESRMEKGCASIDIGTRWTRDDVIGTRSKEGFYDREIIIPALDEYGNSFCEEVMSTEEYHAKRDRTSPEIWKAEYLQQPVDIEGRLFENIQLFNHEQKQDILSRSEGVIGYIDVADEGTDYLCAVVGHIVQNKVYLTDVVFSKANTDITIPACAELLTTNKVTYCRVETNAMGGIFIKELRKRVGESTTLLGVTNSTNKKTRIFMNSSYVLRKFVFSNDTIGQYFQFIEALKNYSHEGSNRNDDAPDAVTGLAMFIQAMFPHLDEQ